MKKISEVKNMYILAVADACDDYALANTLSLFQTAFTIICIVVPIILIISLALTIIGAVTNPDKKGILKTIIIKIAAALIIFFLPSIVNLVISWLPEDKFDIKNCWQKAQEMKVQIDEESQKNNK
ncbi:MAG TPA: hypothetical protein IAB45_06080 [Candidatus Onthousia faecavium]|nr:hypothetical protein [Candidatus Onthousia faecavium]